MSDESIQDTTEALRGILLKELEYRREKQWKIFSLVSTLLTGLTGGIIALRLRPQSPYHFPIMPSTALTLVAIALVWYALRWINYNWKVECRAWKALSDLTATSTLAISPEQKVPTFGYSPAIVLLGVAVLVAIWIPTEASDQTLPLRCLANLEFSTHTSLHFTLALASGG